MRRGNPDMVAAVADSLDFERKYRSAVIAWAPEDRPTDEQIEAVLDEFEKTAWAGLEPDRYAWTAVLLGARRALACAACGHPSPKSGRKRAGHRSRRSSAILDRAESPDAVSRLVREHVGDLEPPADSARYLQKRPVSLVRNDDPNRVLLNGLPETL